MSHFSSSNPAEPIERQDTYQAGPYKGYLAVPLIAQNEAIGVVGVSKYEEGGFTPRQIDLIKSFADQAVIAIENARLFDELQERTQELQQSLDDLRAAQDRLVQTEKLASLGQLTAGIAHEIKNPLNFVNNFAALSAEMIDELTDVLRAVGLPDAARAEVDGLAAMVKGNLDKVVSHGKRADSIVRNMLLHSRTGSGERRMAGVNALVEEAVNLAYHGARAERPGFDVRLESSLAPDAGEAELFPQEIARVLVNLIGNAFHAVAQRSRQEGPGYEPTVAATTRDLGPAVEIRIRDNGTGIPPEVRERMFTPFFTTKPAGEGTGLGLSLSHDIIVKQHGGSIHVATEPGRFTELTVTLPRRQGVDRVPEGEPHERSHSRGRRRDRHGGFVPPAVPTGFARASLRSCIRLVGRGGPCRYPVSREPQPHPAAL